MENVKMQKIKQAYVKECNKRVDKIIGLTVDILENKKKATKKGSNK